MATEGSRTTLFDGRHHSTLHRRQGGAVLLTIGLTVAAEHVRHFRRPARHWPGLSAAQAGSARRVMRGRASRAGCGADCSRGNLQVSGGSAQVAMAKEQLNGAQVGACFEQVNGEGVA